MRHSISAWGALKEAFATFGNEKGLFAALAIVLSVLSLLLLTPAIEAFRAATTLWDPNQEVDLNEFTMVAENITYLKYWIWPYLFASYAGLVLWSRATIGGAEVIYYGGGVSLFGRTIWAFWRLLGAILIMAIMAGIFYAFSAFFLVVVGLGANAQGLPLDNPIALWQSVLTGMLPFYLIFAFGLQMVVFLFTFSLHGQSRDIHMPLHRAFMLMKKNLFWATAVFFLLALVYQVIYFAFFVSVALIVFSAPFWASYLGLLVLFMVGITYQLLTISFGAVYANKVIPELQE